MDHKTSAVTFAYIFHQDYGRFVLVIYENLHYINFFLKIINLESKRQMGQKMHIIKVRHRNPKKDCYLFMAESLKLDPYQRDRPVINNKFKPFCDVLVILPVNNKVPLSNADGERYVS